MPGIQLLAIDFGTIVTLFFVAISVIGAVLNAANNGKEKPKGGNKPKRDSTVRREIEEFLEQQGGRKPQTMVLSEDDLEIVDEPVRRPAPRPAANRPPAPKPKPKTNPQQQRPAKKPPAPDRPRTLPQAGAPVPTHRPGDALSANREMGDGLRKHVQSAMGERIAAQAAKDVPHLSAAGVQSAATDKKLKDDLDAFKVTGKADASKSLASPLLQMLRNPGSVRNAVLLAEIMTPPRALRKQSPS